MVRSGNPNPKRSNDPFPKSPQGLDEAKSRGQIERARNMNILACARTLFANADILPKLVDNVKEEVDKGFNKNAVELLRIIKEPEKQEIDLGGGLDVGVKKIFIDEKTKKKVDKHIDDFIDGK